ncbi:sensor histidine kinase [Novosphingobium sp. ERW19]|uniref:sensor histidine kinase n=1 Tax=Novosphingobium sp. ERW19 TaxID=2726186 RepID=UPI003211DFAC
MFAGLARKGEGKQTTLARWLGASYLRTAVIPLCLIELGFLLSYWATGNFTYQQNVATVTAVSEKYLTDIAARESANITATLGGVEGMTRLLGAEAGEALATPYDPPSSEKARYHVGSDGVFHTTRGKPDEVAAFYSGFHRVGPQEIDKVWRTVRLDHTMRHIKAASPLVRQVYLNTWDSYNRIYPYFDVLTQYAPKMNIPTYNFYYEADARHNPQRKVVWTDAYVDPAGSGWMVSAIAPVYSEKRLEGVVGIDMTLDTVVSRILSLNLPWQGYAMLVGRDGTILALPPAGEKDLGLTELKDHKYADAIRSDTFKPDQFNITRRPELKALAQAVGSGSSRISHVMLGDRDMLATNARVVGPGWTLVVLAPASQILADANSLHDQLITVGVIMLLILLAFYVVFFAFLVWRARAMSRRLARPLREVEQLMDRIGAGEYNQTAPKFGVSEVDNLSGRLVEMGQKLGEAHHRIVAQEAEVRRSYDTERRITTGQRRFINILSHEFRTPLTVIDSSGQILKRRATRLTEDTVVERSDMIRRAVSRIRDVMESALQLVRMEEGQTTCRPAAVALGSMLREAVASAGGERDIEIRLDGEVERAPLFIDRQLIHSALVAIIENACRFSPVENKVWVEARIHEGRCSISVHDEGPGIPAEELPLVRERFYRGSNSTAVPGAGTGLYLANSLIDANGGLLDIQSVPGEGTVVTASLPLATTTTTEFWEAA